MARYECPVCGYVFDEAKEDVRWADLPDDWVCPACGEAKSAFRLVDSAASDESAGFSQRLVRAHRVFGYVFLVVYLFFLWQMVPRLWSYQIEFPARTVVHMTLGMAIGAILVLKVLIVRFFRRLNGTLVPALGTSLFVSTVVLIGISAPFALQDTIMQRSSSGAGLFSVDNLQRVQGLLGNAGLKAAEASQVASPGGLRAGRNVLREMCVECHDLRTVLAKPRTPENWRRTVQRMADRTSLVNPIDETKQWQVTAYLIAISPELQQSAQKMRAQRRMGQQAKQALQSVAASGTTPTVFNLEQARGVFETKCSGCHPTTLVRMSPPRSAKAARALVAQMIEEGLTANKDELSQIIEYLTKTYGDTSK